MNKLFIIYSSHIGLLRLRFNHSHTLHLLGHSDDIYTVPCFIVKVNFKFQNEGAQFYFEMILSVLYKIRTKTGKVTKQK